MVTLTLNRGDTAQTDTVIVTRSPAIVDGSQPGRDNSLNTVRLTPRPDADQPDTMTLTALTLSTSTVAET